MLWKRTGLDGGRYGGRYGRSLAPAGEGAWGEGGLAEAAEQEEGLHVTGAGRQPRTPEGDQHGQRPIREEFVVSVG